MAVGEAERLEVMVRRLLDEGAGVEPSDGGGVRLTAEDGRATFLTEEGLATLPNWLRQRLLDDASEREAIRAEANWRPASWADVADTPHPGDWCGCCRGQRWWREREEPRGWRCLACHPPPITCPPLPW